MALQPNKLVAAELSRVGDTRVNTVGMKFAYVPAGEFLMGSPANEQGRRPDEIQHHVKLTRPFAMAITTVTQAQWSAVMGRNPEKVQADDLPIERVSWSDAAAFCEKLGTIEGKHYRLPTEAQWEYACRAGTQTAYGGTGNLDEMGWYADNSGDGPLDSDEILRTDNENYARRLVENDCRPRPVATKMPNAWGLFDMHGNVNEWCSDLFGPYSGDAVDPTGAENAFYHVLRGGSWGVTPSHCRAAMRGGRKPDHSDSVAGFRVCLDF